MKGSLDMDFCFKGSRTYVHGTDIYNQLVAYLQDKNETILSLDLSFHGIAKNNLILSNKKPDDETSLKFAFKYMDINNKKQILYGSKSNKTIDCRYEYNEDMICKVSMLDIKKQTVELNEDTGYSFIENIVALNKYLLENLFPDVQGKWYFTRLQLKENMNEYNTISSTRLIFKSNFNFKLIKTEIFVNNKTLGFIYFSLV